MDSTPWWSREAIAAVEPLLAPGMKVFEWGSGGSTVWFAARTEFVIAVESYPPWLEQVGTELKRLGVTNVQFVYSPATGCDCIDETCAYRSDVDIGRCYRLAAHAIDVYGDESFDVVSVDGFARNVSIARAIPKVKPGGILILDNSERPHYAPGVALMRGWERSSATGPCSVGGGSDEMTDFSISNTVFRKPE